MLISFSIIIPTWNRQILLERAIQSVRSNRDNFLVEIIVIDNASKIPANIDKFNDLDIRLIRLDKNYGPSIARNKGIELAKYNFIYPLDDDDEIMRGGLKIIAQYYEKNKFYLETKPVFCFATNLSRLKEDFHIYNLKEYLGCNYGDVATVINKKKWNEFSLCYPSSKIGGESILWIKVAKYYNIPIYNIPVENKYDDASIRLTNFKNQISRASEYMDFQKEVVSLIKDDKKEFKKFYCKKMLGYSTYAVLSGRKKEAYKFIANQNLDKLFFIKNFLILLIPRSIMKLLFKTYRSFRKWI
jgi:GalNAc5-diNAcBac-PP-undecaprenol beta-1,3-glucosyltransferase